MKKGLLGSTALVAATALSVGAAQAQGSAPTWKLSGFMNFQLYIPSGDITGVSTKGGFTTAPVTGIPTSLRQDSPVYFGVDDAEIQVNVDGTTDAGLDYGFKIELNANTTDGLAADEARIQLGGSWGVVQLGDEDGAEDIMNYGGETIMGATGAWDGDGDDVMGDFADLFYPTIAGDTSDHTKASYFSPRFSGIQLGASWTPEPAMDGDEKKNDSAFENHIGLGANYDNTFGNVRVRLSGVYSMATARSGVGFTPTEDIGAYSLGGILGFGGFSVAANWTDNGESGAPTGAGADHNYYNLAVAWEGGPWYLSGGYIAHTYSATGVPDLDATSYGATVDYTVAPGLVTYAEYTNYKASTTGLPDVSENILILGTQVSF